MHREGQREREKKGANKNNKNKTAAKIWKIDNFVSGFLKAFCIINHASK